MDESLRFSYQPYGGAQDDGALRPFLPIMLTLHGSSTETLGLLDSGSDVNVLPYSLGLTLGAVWDEQRLNIPLTGNLARHETRGLLLVARIGHFEPVQLAFAWTRTDDVPVLLGQTNFFAEYNVCFYRSQNSFEVRPRDRAAG